MRPLSYFAHPLTTLAPRDLLLLEALDARSSDAVLEIGTGSGSSLFRLADSVAAFHGVDVCEGPVERLRRVVARRPGRFANVQLFTLDFCAPNAASLLPTSYDLIFSCDTVEHVADAAAFLGNIHRALKPGGRVFLTYPNEHPSIAHGITFFERREVLEQMLADAGFARHQVEIHSLRMSRLAERIMQLGWLAPRRLAKGVLRFFRGAIPRNGAPQTFAETDFYTASDRLEPAAPLINAYCWGVMKVMSLARPVYEILPAPEIIWDTRILIRATRGGEPDPAPGAGAIRPVRAAAGASARPEELAVSN